MDHPNARLLREAYDAFTRGDLEAVRGYFAPDIVFHSPPGAPISGDYEGIDAVFGFLGKLFQETGGTFKLEIHDVLGSDDHAVGITYSNFERHGKKARYRNIHLAHIKDGKVTEWWEFPEYPASVDAWS